MVKLGYDTVYSGAQMSLPIKDIQRAEELGFDSVWACESYGSDAFIPLAYIAAHTKRIRLGTGVAQLAARTPANFAMVIQTLEELAGRGRVVAGLGVSGPQIVEGWYGQPWGKPNPRLRDYVAIVRKILRREGPVTHEGPEISLPYKGPGAIGLGRPLKSILHGNPNIPILLGASKPANVRLAGEIADGWIVMYVWPEDLPRELELIKQGMAKRTDGKSLKDFEIVTNLGVHITNDLKAAFEQSKKVIALYVGGMGAKEMNFHKDCMVNHGFAKEAERIQELYLAGHKDEAAAIVPDEYMDQQGLFGPPERIKERFARWRDAGFTTFRLAYPNEEAMVLMSKLVRA
jgi:F420-dependent oxidoreductase-like protein